MPDDADIIAAIYDAVIDPAGWETVVRLIVQATKSISGGVIVRANCEAFAATYNVDISYLRSYTEHFPQDRPDQASGGDHRAWRNPDGDQTDTVGRV